MGLVIRPAAPSDAPGIAELEIETSGHPWSEDSILHDITESNIAVVISAELDDKLVGYADVWNIAGEGQLNNIAVTGAARGNHIGQKMMEYLFDALRESGATEMSLEVRVSNTPARRMYEKLGFVNLGIRPGYYEDNGEDAVIYRKDL